ncbi:hypothetical protein D3D02_05365 [Halobellus sp. Atlit-38R]|uniref:DUF7549 family protein n=1 Tax=Halobellus sp. Atlit-38R TaxID=2282131 RepID=UPI000EF275E0|nr:hypothetical protein [Halobellus sp. Atlit-38R]RLM90198.1 hypothetical protein D3D02_05365 [Halobellus sp. Atlit-38R]
MVWVRSEYAGALAVVSTWVAALVPWNVTYSSGVSGGSVLFVRFPFFQIRYAFGVPVARRVSVSDPLSAVAFQAGQTIQAAYQVWAVGAAVLAIAVVVAAAYYHDEARVESGPLDPVRLLGGLLALSGVVLAGATYLLATRGFPGVPLPIGVVFLLLFGGVLLTVDRE